MVSLVTGLGVAGYYFALMLSKIQRIKHTPISTVNLAREDKVCLQGKARPFLDKALISPISKRECC